jgi:calcineurin-like phosphoesterase
VKNGIKIGVCVVLGPQFMKIHASCPFEAMERILQDNGSSVNILLAEIHAEATSEKIAFGWNFDGKVTGIVGTHTHVQTSDERILPNGTAHITDLGMCGPHESVIGREILPVLHSMKLGMPQKLEIASGDIRLNGIILTINSHSGLATKIVTFSERMS